MRQHQHNSVWNLCRTGLGASLVAIIAACGGHDVPSASIGDTAYPACGGTPAVAAVQGYPVYRLSAANVNACDVLTHYDAGYAIVADGDVDVWGPTDGMPKFTMSSGVDATEPTGDGLLISTVAVGTSVPVATQSETATTFVLAKSADNAAPVECQLQNSDATQLQSDIENCLASVRTTQTQQRALTRAGTASIKAQTSDSADGIGNTSPDPTAWTLLGTSAQEVSIDSYTDNWWQPTQKTGTAALRFSVYRLNASDQNDYYLVKAVWDTNPVPRINATHPTIKDTCVKGDYCGYYNNLHTIAFSLSVIRNGQTTRGAVESYMPRTVERNKTVSEKIGGDLSVSDKGVSGKINSEISTSYSYSALNILSAATRGTVEFTASHATSKRDIWDADPTTIGGGRKVAWVLFSVPAGSARIEDSIQVGVSKFEGNFGLRADNDLLPHVYLYDYKLDQPYTVSFSPPVFAAKVVNADGTVQALPMATSDVVRLKPGQSTTIRVTAGDETTPVRLSWQVTDASSWLSTSAGKNSVRSGDEDIVVTADNAAVPGTTGYVRINTSPRGAAAALRQGDLNVRIQVVN
ncbi:hypothetical protein [Chitinasiproducens palmae]|uniref:BACON domain-containing protein n=1 Tax=Chitinasiproducens palmae TaxID=1770053 RepID=A0A1H2PL82_9BURK|nr:hypothetical protein [Chitinasiproducens palmae]SDV46818.1 hypothetical protein SAMN05216551_10211 [Chitinasiproducens palmae]